MPASADEDQSNPDPVPESRIVADSGADLVIAKSFGTLVTMLANREYGFQPAKCVMITVPLVRFKIQNLIPLLHHHCASVPTLFIQKTADFNGPYAELASETGAYPGCRAAEVAGDDHLYSDLTELKRIIEAWLCPHRIPE